MRMHFDNELSFGKRRAPKIEERERAGGRTTCEFSTLRPSRQSGRSYQRRRRRWRACVKRARAPNGGIKAIPCFVRRCVCAFWPSTDAIGRSKSRTAADTRRFSPERETRQTFFTLRGEKGKGKDGLPRRSPQMAHLISPPFSRHVKPLKYEPPRQTVSLPPLRRWTRVTGQTSN